MQSNLFEKQNRIVEISKGLLEWFLKWAWLNTDNAIHKQVT